MNDYRLTGGAADFDSPHTDYAFLDGRWWECAYRYPEPAHRLVNLTTEQEAKILVHKACDLWYIRNDPKKYGMDGWF